MFLVNMPSENGLHELDFRFETYPGEENFLFAHHGATLDELMDTCGLASLGSTFYVVEVASPFALPEAISNSSLMHDRYGVAPSVVHDHYLRLDAEAFAKFVQNTRADTELDCTILATHGPDVSQEDIQRFLEAIKDRAGRVPLAGLSPGSCLHTHDNHFLWLAAQPVGLLRTLINASVVGFFSHVRPRSYAPLPGDIIDLILTKYHTAPLVCFPTEWDENCTTEVPSGVQITSDSVQALVQTAESSWIAYQLNPPKELLRRGLLISYRFGSESWAIEEWR